MNNLIIIGASALGIQLQHHIQETKQSINILGWLDDWKNKGDIYNGLPVLGKLEDVIHFEHEERFLIAIGYKHLIFKQSLIKRLEGLNKHQFTFIHPSAIVDPTAIIEEGVIIYPGAVIDMNVRLKKGVLVNNGAVISHDSYIGQSTFIAPGVTICGHVKIGEYSFIGAGTTISDGVEIVKGVTIGSGANVHKSISIEGVYVQKSKLNSL